MAPNGVASVTAAADGTGGSYTVTASAAGAATAGGPTVDFSLTNIYLIPLAFSRISIPSITYGTSSVAISGMLARGSQAPVGETLAMTLDGVQQPVTIGSGGAFSTTFNADGLTVARSPYTVSFCLYQRRDLQLRDHVQQPDDDAGDVTSREP